LTRQIAVHDATDRGHAGLADYYAERDSVDKLHRQPTTKGRTDRTLVIRRHVVTVLLERRSRVHGDADLAAETPVFASGSGDWLSPANIRTRLRRAVASHTALAGVSPHTIRRTVGTHITHQRGLDDARDRLGHSDPSVTFQHYVGRRERGPDCRDVLDQSFPPSPGATGRAPGVSQ
jgi:integrase